MCAIICIFDCMNFMPFLIKFKKFELYNFAVSTWMGDRLRAGIPYQYVTSQLGQLSLASLRGRLIEYQLRLG